jgi:YafQ family addiction module toxin component
MHNIEIDEDLHKILNKLYKKDRSRYEATIKKIEEVTNSDNIDHYKNLKHNLKDYKRAHIGSFVIIFRFNKTEDKIYFVYYDHHDNVYEWRPK